MTTFITSSSTSTSPDYYSYYSSDRKMKKSKVKATKLEEEVEKDIQQNLPTFDPKNLDI